MGIIDDIKYKFINQQDAVKRIIMLNVLVFVVLMLPHVVFFLAQIDTSSYHWFLNKLKLPASFGTLLMQPWSILTYMFLHDGIFHILFNMLWIFFPCRCLCNHEKSIHRKLQLHKQQGQQCFLATSL